jgi:hypothetical protein
MISRIFGSFVGALRALHRSVVDRKGDSIALLERHDLGAALHAWPLFGQDELAACEVLVRLGEDDRDLDRECQICVEVLVEAVEIARHIPQ